MALSPPGSATGNSPSAIYLYGDYLWCPFVAPIRLLRPLSTGIHFYRAGGIGSQSRLRCVDTVDCGLQSAPFSEPDPKIRGMSAAESCRRKSCYTDQNFADSVENVLYIYLFESPLQAVEYSTIDIQRYRSIFLTGGGTDRRVIFARKIF